LSLIASLLLILRTRENGRLNFEDSLLYFADCDAQGRVKFTYRSFANKKDFNVKQMTAHAVVMSGDKLLISTPPFSKAMLGLIGSTRPSRLCLQSTQSRYYNLSARLLNTRGPKFNGQNKSTQTTPPRSHNSRSNNKIANDAKPAFFSPAATRQHKRPAHLPSKPKPALRPHIKRDLLREEKFKKLIRKVTASPTPAPESFPKPSLDAQSRRPAPASTASDAKVLHRH